MTIAPPPALANTGRPVPELCPWCVGLDQEPTTPLGKLRALRDLIKRFPDHPRDWVEEQIDDLVEDLEGGRS